jgi:hypothetical protein
MMLLPLALSVSPGQASACGNAVIEVVDTSAINIAAAEKALGDGRYAAAVVGVNQVFPAIAQTAVGAKPLSDRGLRIVALAAVRLDGAITLGSQLQGTTAEGRADNLTFAIDTLRKLNARRPNNPSLQTDLGEALSKVPRFKAEAFKLLNELAQKDLVASAEGYAALAKLRENLGDQEGARLALKRSAEMSKGARAPQKPTASSAGARS